MASEKLCTNCGHVDVPRTKTPGHALIELILWLTFILPGIIFSIWRHSSKFKVCRQCGAPNPIDLNSPMARQIRPDIEPPSPSEKQGLFDFTDEQKDYLKGKLPIIIILAIIILFAIFSDYALMF